MEKSDSNNDLLFDTPNKENRDAVETLKLENEPEENNENQQKNKCLDSVYFKIPPIGWLLLFCQLIYAFANFGMRGIFTIYLNKAVGLSSDQATIVYHIQPFISSVAAFFGAFVADNYWGRLKTILVFGIIHVIGVILFPLTAITVNVAMVLISFLVLFIGKGSSMAAFIPFAGDQIPKNPPEIIEGFYSLFYFSNNVGAICGMYMTPVLADLECIGQSSCYSLAFGVCAILFLVFVGMFLGGIPLYKNTPNQGKAISQAFKCMWSALTRWRILRKTEPKKSILEYADQERFSPKFIADVQQTLKVFIFFIPFPVFWALFEQQGSRWPLQGLMMKRSFLSSAQMQMINPLLVCILIPLFNNVLYPILGKMHLLKSNISRIFVGYLFVTASFIASGFVQLRIDQGKPTPVPNGQARLQFINLVPCSVNIESPMGAFHLGTSKSERTTSGKLYDAVNGDQIFHLYSNCSSLGMNTSFPYKIPDKEAVTLAIVSSNSNALEIVPGTVDQNVVGTNGNVRVFGNVVKMNVSAISSDGETFVLMSRGQNVTPTYSDYNSLPRGTYIINMTMDNVDETFLGNLIIDEAETVTLGIYEENASYKMETLIEGRTQLIPILYQIIQYVLVTIGEIFLSVTVSILAYTEAPASMKTFVNFNFTLTIVGGNLLVVFVASIPRVTSLMWEYFIFGIVCTLAGIANVIIYKLLGMTAYTSKEVTE